MATTLCSSSQTVTVIILVLLIITLKLLDTLLVLIIATIQYIQLSAHENTHVFTNTHRVG